MNKSLERECKDTILIMNLISSINKENSDSLLSEKIIFYSYLDKENLSEDELMEIESDKLAELDEDECFQLLSTIEGISFHTFNFHRENNNLLGNPSYEIEWINDGFTPIVKHEVILLHFLQMIPYEY